MPLLSKIPIKRWLKATLAGVRLFRIFMLEQGSSRFGTTDGVQCASFRTNRDIPAGPGERLWTENRVIQRHMRHTQCPTGPRYWFVVMEAAVVASVTHERIQPITLWAGLHRLQQVLLVMTLPNEAPRLQGRKLGSTRCNTYRNKSGLDKPYSFLHFDRPAALIHYHDLVRLHLAKQNNL